jgi:hypothetical protein
VRNGTKDSVGKYYQGKALVRGEVRARGMSGCNSVSRQDGSLASDDIDDFRSVDVRIVEPQK